MKFDQTLVNRIATLTKGQVAELPHIHIPNEGILFQLMVWRNRNKETVRSFLPVVNEGVISAIVKENFQYFNQNGNDIFHMNVSSPDQYVAFSYNTDSWEVTKIANTITFYPTDEIYQDMITVHATVMAYLNTIGVNDIKSGEVYTISEVAM